MVAMGSSAHFASNYWRVKKIDRLRLVPATHIAVLCVFVPGCRKWDGLSRDADMPCVSGVSGGLQYGHPALHPDHRVGDAGQAEVHPHVDSQLVQYSMSALPVHSHQDTTAGEPGDCVPGWCTFLWIVAIQLHAGSFAVLTESMFNAVLLLLEPSDV